MSSLLREHFGAVVWSVALHAAVVAALAIGADFVKRPQTPEVVAIEAIVVDETLLARVEEQREEVERQREAEEAERQRQAEAERQRQAEAERQRQAEAERQRQAEEAERQRQAEAERERQAEAERQRQAEAERQRQAEEAERQRQAEAERQRQAEEAERQRQAEAERQRQAEEAERQRQAEAERQRQAEAERQRQAEAERRRQEEARLQAELDAELQREAERLTAMRSGALDEYRAMLKSAIEQNWNRPPSARPGVDCTVHVRQIPSGEVISAQVTSCNGDEAVVRSIENAVLRASPLPLPSEPSLFERNLIIDFVPDE